MKEENEHLCAWPNGEQRMVLVTSVVDECAKIIWNERMPNGKLIGMDETVPVSWIVDLGG